jgi:hypothetical protein
MNRNKNLLTTYFNFLALFLIAAALADDAGLKPVQLRPISAQQEKAKIGKLALIHIALYNSKH